MTEYFQEITQCFVTLAISDSVVNPNLPDYSTSTYASLGREIRYVPESTSPMLPNFIPYGPSARQIGRFYPTGTSAPTYSVDDLKPLQTTGLVKTQITVGRWMAICDNENCLDDCAEGFWEKHVVWTSRPSKSLRRSNPWEDVPNAIARSKSMYLEFDCGSRQASQHQHHTPKSSLPASRGPSMPATAQYASFSIRSPIDHVDAFSSVARWHDFTFSR